MAAVVLPLARLAGLGETHRSPVGGVSAPGLLVVEERILPGVIYVEGSVTHVDVRDAAGRLVGSFNGLLHGPSDPLLALTLDPGRYRLAAYQRPCLLGCDFQLGSPVDRCEGLLRLASASQLTATLELSPTKGCVFDVRRGSIQGRIPPRSPLPLPDVAEIECDQAGTHLLTPQVQPQVDGVHFLEHRQDGAPVFIVPPPGGLRFGFPGSRDDTVENVYPIAPGRSQIVCLGGGRKPSDQSLYVPLDVVDEEGLWGSPTLGCPLADQAFRADVLYATAPAGEAGDPVELVRKYLQGTEPGDVIELAGYPGAANPAVRVLRLGRIVAIVQFKENSDGRWVFDDIGGAFGFCRSDVEGFGETPLG